MFGAGGNEWCNSNSSDDDWCVSMESDVPSAGSMQRDGGREHVVWVGTIMVAGKSSYMVCYDLTT